MKLTQGDHITGINDLPTKSACINGAKLAQGDHNTGINALHAKEPQHTGIKDLPQLHALYTKK